MELLYLYIPSNADGILKNVNLNFTGRHQFNFDKESRTLTYKENLKAVDNTFFSQTKYNSNKVVENISAIVGDNGAGKTTIADFIYKINLLGGTEHILLFRQLNMPQIMQHI